jgi:hypothetical protein
MVVRFSVFALCLLVSHLLIGQAVPAEITNSDVISMTKAGIGEQTIILAIQRGSDKFDSSPQALIAMKAAGVSDQVLNAILAATGAGNRTVSTAGASNRSAPEVQIVDGRALFEKAVASFGPKERLADIHAYATVQTATRTSQGTTDSFTRYLTRVFPDKVHLKLVPSSGPPQEHVITSALAYSVSVNQDLPPTVVDPVRVAMQFDPIYVAQHAQDYTVSSMGKETVGGTYVEKLMVSKGEATVVWGVASQTGRLLFVRQSIAGQVTETDFEDYRQVAGVFRPYKTTVKEPYVTTSYITTETDFNPKVDEHLFDRPVQSIKQIDSRPSADSSSESLTVRVLQEQSIPYIQESRGGISTTCSIVGNASTSAYANSYGNTTYGNATTTLDQHMTCNSYDTTMRWPHILNVMFVQASNRNSYIIGCDRAWRWSKCVPLRAGDTFSARFTEKGMQVDSFNTKGKEESPTYHILQSKVSQ